MNKNPHPSGQRLALLRETLQFSQEDFGVLLSKREFLDFWCPRLSLNQTILIKVALRHYMTTIPHSMAEQRIPHERFSSSGIGVMITELLSEISAQNPDDGRSHD